MIPKVQSGCQKHHYPAIVVEQSVSRIAHVMQHWRTELLTGV